MADLEDELIAAAEGPAEASDDEGRMKSHPLPDLVGADQHLRRTAAAARTGLPLRFGKLRPPGAI